MISPSVSYIFKDLFHDILSWFSHSASAMDIQTVMICGCVFVISAAVVYLISAFGMRERTYEEAMEEQRRRNQEAMHHTKNDRGKKDKKYKKWNKRSKEKNEDEKSQIYDNDQKRNPDETEIKGDSGSNSSSQNMDLKPSSKKKIRQRKTAHFEKEGDQVQQLSSSEETDELPSISNSPEILLSTKEDSKSLLLDSTKIKEELKTLKVDSQGNHPGEFHDKAEMTDHPRPINKKSPLKKKRSKTDFLDSGSEIPEWSEIKILNAIKMASFTDDEIQRIIDTLSSRQKIHEKRKSEMHSLKKLIQDKEDALKAEQKISQAANEKINDLLQELSDVKTQASTIEKSLRSALNQEQQEIKGLHDMMQRKQKHYSDEIATMQSKMKKMKNIMKEEHAMAIQRLQDENNQLQSLNRMEAEKNQRSSLEISRLQHEIDQLRSSREKFESHQTSMQQTQEDLHREIHQLEQIISSHQEDDFSYKQRINEMSNKIQQAENARSSLMQELQTAQSVCSSLESENSSFRQRLEEMKHQLNSSEQNALQLQNSLEAKSIEIQEQEAVYKKKESMIHQLVEEMDQCSNERDKLLKELSCVKKKNDELSEKNKDLNQALKMSQGKMQEVLKSAELKVQEAQKKVDKNSHEMQNLLSEQIKEVELALRESFSKELKNARLETENIKKQADDRVLKTEVEANLRLEEFQESLYERLNILSFEAESKINEAHEEKELLKSELEEMKVVLKSFFQEIIPNISVPEKIDSSFLNSCNSKIQLYINELKEKQPENSEDLEKMACKLEEKILENAVYENVLCETESVLKSLQDNIELQEKNWVKESETKDKALEIIKKENESLKFENDKLRLSLEQLQDLRESLCEIEELRIKLQKEETDKKMLQEKIKMIDMVSKPVTCPINENNILELTESNIVPNKSEKRKKSRKRGGSGKK